MGIIKNTNSGKVLSITGDGVKVEEQKLDNSTSQMWKISLVDASECLWFCFNSSGYIIIENPSSGKLLTAPAAFDLRVLSMINMYC